MFNNINMFVVIELNNYAFIFFTSVSDKLDVFFNEMFNAYTMRRQTHVNICLY